MDKLPQPILILVAAIVSFIALAAACEQSEWDARIDAAFEPSTCPPAPSVEFDISDYTGPLIDTHFHIPPLPQPDRYEEVGVMPNLGWNVTIPEIACTLEQEGTSKVFAFFSVFTYEADPLLKVVDQTMKRYPSQFVPFINPPGSVEGVPTVNADVLSEMLSKYPGLFQGYGEIGLYPPPGQTTDDYPPDAPILRDIYAIAQENALAVYLHPGDGHEDSLERALQEYPEVSFIVHGEGIEKQIAGLMAKYSNVYFTVNDLYGDQYLLHPGETTESFLAALSDYEPLLEKDLATWKDAIEAHPDQFLWGTDRGGIAVWTFDLKVGQALVDYARAFIGRLDPEVQERFAYKNAERLFPD